MIFSRLVFGYFIYRRSAGRIVELDVAILKDAGGLSIECPMCGRRSRLNPLTRVLKIRDREVPVAGHRVLVDRRGRVTVTRPVLCPNSACGWHVRVTKGRAVDACPVDEPGREDALRVPIRKSFTEARVPLSRPSPEMNPFPEVS